MVEKALWLQDMSWPEVEAALRTTDVVLVPVGSTEQHGPHLPLGVDTHIPIYAAERVSEQTGVPIAPPIWLAHCEWHMGFPGTISIRPSTLIALLNDLFRSLRRHGFKHFIMINGHTHGLNPILISAADETQTEFPDVRVWVADVVLMARDAVLQTCEAEFLVHGDELETSQMLVAKPDLVRTDVAGPVSSPKFRSRFMQLSYRAGGDQVLWRMTAADWKEWTTTGQLGDPTLATEAKGRAIMDALVKNVSTLISELRA